MPMFKYIARDSTGKEVTGTINAEHVDGVAEKLLSEELVPIKMVLAKGSESVSIFKKDLMPAKTVRLQEMTAFCRQMTTMVKVGIPLIDAIMHLSTSTQSPVFKRILPEMAEAISGGQTLTEALRLFPDTFSPVFINIVMAGERSGQLEKSFTQLAEYLVLEDKTKKQIKSATRYPMMVIAAALIALGIVNFMVIPTFSQMFEQFDAELPLPTQILVTLSNFMMDYWFLLLLVAVGIFLGFKYALKTRQGRHILHRYMLKMPIFGPVINNAVLARFARMFSLMLSTGIPLIEAIELVANTIGNQYVTDKMMEMQQGIEAGESFSRVATETGLFSPMILQMLSIGEQTGSMDNLLAEMAVYYEAEVDYDLARIGELIEPILLAIMGAMVLLIAVGVFLPMWSMVSFTKG